MRFGDAAMRPLGKVWMLTLIGVVLAVLTTSMVATPALSYSLWVPAAATAQPVPRGAVTVGIDKHGRFWLDDTVDPGPIPTVRLPERLEAAFAARGGERVLYLEGDRSVPYAVVLTLLDVARDSGVRQLELIAVCPPGEESLLRRCGG